MDSIRQRINRIGIVERLSTKNIVKGADAIERGTVIDVGVGLYDPDELLDRVVEVQLDLVGRGTNRLIASELELLDKVLVGVLCHTAALVGIKEHVIDEEGSRNERLVVGIDTLDAGAAGARGVEGGDSPEALIDRTEIDVNTNLVVLESDKRESKSGITAVPELKRDIEGGLRERVTRSANLAGSIRLARTINVRERGVA